MPQESINRRDRTKEEARSGNNPSLTARSSNGDKPVRIKYLGPWNKAVEASKNAKKIKKPKPKIQRP